MKHKILLSIITIFIILSLTGCVYELDKHDCLEWECTYLNKDNMTATTITVNESDGGCQASARVDCVYKDNCHNAPLKTSRCIKWTSQDKEPRIYTDNNNI